MPKEATNDIHTAADAVLASIAEFTEAVVRIQDAVLSIDDHAVTAQAGIDEHVAAAKSDIGSQVASAKADINTLAAQAHAGVDQHFGAIVRQAIRADIYFIVDAVKEGMRRLGG